MFWLGLVIGVLMGVFFGALTMAMLSLAKMADEKRNNGFYDKLKKMEKDRALRLL